MTHLAIQFHIRYAETVNHPDRRREFSDGLHWFITNEAGLACMWGGQGGGATVYGAMYREEEAVNITVADRDRVAGWIRKQRIDCTATFGNPESMDAFDMMRELTDLVFEVRNLTDEDRDAGRAYRKSVLDRIKANGWRMAEPE